MKENDTRGTPWDLFHEIERLVGCTFSVDVCTSHKLAKCPTYYTLEGKYTVPDYLPIKLSSNCGLSSDWDTQENHFCNPPFSGGLPGKWIAKCWREAERMAKSSNIAALVPSNCTEQAWWQSQVEPYRDGKKPLERVYLVTHNLRGRRRFTDEQGNPVYAKDTDGNIRYKKNGEPMIGSPRFGVCILHWRIHE